MFTESTLRKLLDFSANDPVVSVYLNTEPSRGNADAHRLRLRSLLKEMSLKQDEEAIERFFNHSYDWSGRGVAVFSCAPAGFFHHMTLSLPVDDQIVIAGQPEITPLLSLVDNYGGYGVVLIDKQNARLFLFQQGELVEQQAISGEEVKHIKTGSNVLSPGGGPQEKSRTLDEVIERNMRELAELATRYFEGKHVRRIMIGGSEENIAAFKGQLSKAWLSLLTGTFSISMNAGLSEVLEKSLAVNHKAELEQEEALVDTLITAAAKESAAVVGLEDTLDAVSNGRVQKLVFTEGLTSRGYWHKDCGLLTTLAIKKHHACPEPAGRVDDVVSLAATAVLKSGGSVEVLHPGTALDEHGKMGAVLRY